MTMMVMYVRTGEGYRGKQDRKKSETHTNQPSPYEYDLQKIVADRFTRDGIFFVPEYVLGKNARIDFFVSGLEEVKKGIPNRTNVLRQLGRYAEHEEIKYLILVSERKMHKNYRQEHIM